MILSFKSLLQKAPRPENCLTNSQLYWAHTHPEKPVELLHKHIELVNDYACRICEAHGLDAVIDSLCTSVGSDFEDKHAAVVLLKECFVGIVVFHDFGKVNADFQAGRMGNRAFQPQKNNPLNPPHGHSRLGVFLYLGHYLTIILNSSLANTDKQWLIAYCFLLSYCINQHHSSFLDNPMSMNGFLSSFKHSFDDLFALVQKIELPLASEQVASILDYLDTTWQQSMKDARQHPPFVLFALVKLGFSMLTAADYLATHEYMSSSESKAEARVDNLGVFENHDRISTLANNLQNYRHNKTTFSQIDDYHFIHPETKSGENLNTLRREIAVKVIQTIRSNTDRRLFYLEAPTGSGKTNLSAIVATELLLANPELKKVIYVFPFTTLITQTYAALKDSLKLLESEIAELHSKAAPASRDDPEQVQDGVYGAEKKDYINRLFALFPFALMSHVRFFDILCTNEKEPNYLLHRLANSVVIVDELQSYNPLIWDRMLYFIQEYAQHFNIRFVLMSATLPRISGLKLAGIAENQFVDLLPDATRYLQNVNFSGRVRFDFELLGNDPIGLNNLAEKVLSASYDYASEHGTVKTIIEFIFKRSAADCYRLFQNQTFFSKVFLLSGTILDARRREIINHIKRSENRENILLITTQVVEAGVDIDMDLGFKNLSLLDSDEQLAGRVNRNARKPTCDVYLFYHDDPSVLYKRDFRYKITQAGISLSERQEILATKDFNRLYQLVLDRINQDSMLKTKGSIKDYQDAVYYLDFREVSKQFQIIDQQNSSVFVPLNLPLIIPGPAEDSFDEIFSSQELAFLSKHSICPDDTGQISGKEVWELYETLVAGRSRDSGGFRLDAIVSFKQLQSVMAKFCFSLMTAASDYYELMLFGSERLGYLYLAHWDQQKEYGQPYSYEGGLNKDAFKESNFL